MNISQDASISLSLVFSIFSMLGVIVVIIRGIRQDSLDNTKKEVGQEKRNVQIEGRIDEHEHEISYLKREIEKNSDRIDKESEQNFIQNERIGTLFRIHEDNKERIMNIEKTNSRKMK